ncbi:hypothetical protein [Vibrio agarivorans]|uniref:hypothetical protein n=1 Tax=Vibrio agarivorans TaxID=153622 RepID=UPI0025B3F4C8|nr:hypothetical protein [Vibrio agarivorans]MDN3661102.1 hypothetical protein [Vibrio agarivorans]
MSDSLTNDDLKKEIEEKKKELDQLKEATHEKMRVLNNVDVMYKGINMQDVYAPDPNAQKSEPTQRQTTSNMSPFASALHALVNSKNKPQSPRVSLEENAIKLAERKAAMGGESKVKSLADNINQQLDKVMSTDTTASEVEAAFKQIRTDIAQINQEMALNLKATQHVNGDNLNQAIDSIKQDNSYLQKLATRIQKDAPSLNIRNDILPDSAKIDFHAFAGKISDSVNNLTSTLKNFASKLMPSSQSPTT